MDMPQPLSLDELFQHCHDNPNFIPTARDAIRIANGTRLRIHRNRRRGEIEVRRATAIENLNRSFTSNQVPDPNDLELVSEQDPDAAFLLFHETGGLWRFDPRINGGSTEAITRELEQEKCSPERISNLIRSFEQRLSISQDIKACGWCCKRQIIGDNHLRI